MGAAGLVAPGVVEPWKGNQTVGGRGLILGVFSTNPESSVHGEVGPEMMARRDVPIRSDGGSGKNRYAGPFSNAVNRGDYAPQAQPRKGAKLTGAEILFSHH